MSEDITPNTSGDEEESPNPPTLPPTLQSSLPPSPENTPNPSDSSPPPPLSPTLQSSLPPSPDPSEDGASTPPPPPPLSPTIRLAGTPYAQTSPDPSDSEDSSTLPPSPTQRTTPSPTLQRAQDPGIEPVPLSPPLTPHSHPMSPTTPRTPLPLNPKQIPPNGFRFRESDSLPASNNTAKKLEFTIVLVGKSGAGKSTLAKNVFGINFDAEMSAKSRTQGVQDDRVTNSNITLKIVDTPGLEIMKANQLKPISKHVKGKAHLLLYCLPINPGSRFHDSNPDIMRCLQEAFGKDIWRHCMVVLTFSNLAWDHIRRNHRSRETAAIRYNEYIQEYATEFKEELRNLKVESNVKTVFDLIPRIQNNDSHFLYVPAGLRHEDPVLAGGHYRIDKMAASFLSAKFAESFSASAQQLQYNWQTDSEVITDSWAAVLVSLILQRCTRDSSPAVLQFWYGRKRIGAALKRTGAPLAMGGGSVAGGAVGGAVGVAVGAVVGAPGGPIGVPLVACLGLLVGTMIGGGGAAGVVGAVGQALDIKGKGKMEQGQREEDSETTNSIIL